MFEEKLAAAHAELRALGDEARELEAGVDDVLGKLLCGMTRRRPQSTMRRRRSGESERWSRDHGRNSALDDWIGDAEMPVASWSTSPLAELCDDVEYGVTASLEIESCGTCCSITDIVPPRIDWESVPTATCRGEIGRFERAMGHRGGPYGCTLATRTRRAMTGSDALRLVSSPIPGAATVPIRRMSAT